MPRYVRRRGGARLGIVVVVVVCVGATIVLLPAIGAVREAARRKKCADNLRQWALGYSSYHAVHQHYPMSSAVTRDAAGKIVAVDGWSFRAVLLPYIECSWPVFDLDIEHGHPLAEPVDAEGTPHADALKTSFPLLLCPSYSDSPYADPETKREAISNYKAMGATHHESLSVASPEPRQPRYAPERTHPDGACFPGTALKRDDFRDGLSNTLLFAESVEPRFSRWTVGAEAAIVGLSPDTEFEDVGKQRSIERSWFAPKGYAPGQYENESIPDAKWPTYLCWDYDERPYDGADGMRGGKYGPSSHHALVVNHVFAGGEVRTIPCVTDVSLYMFLITRNGHDPASEFYPPCD